MGGARSSSAARGLQDATERAAAGDWTGARRLCGAVLRADPHSARALHILGAVCAGEGDFTTAESWLSRALALEPLHASWQRDLTAVRLAMGSAPAALDAVEKSLAIEPGNRSGLRLRALALRDAGRLEAAAQAFDHWGAAEAGEIEAWLGAAQCFLESDRLPEAALRARRALQIDPDSVKARQLLATAYFQAFEPGNGLVQCLEIARLLPGEPEALAFLALAYHNLGDNQRALDLFRTASPASLPAALYAAYLLVLLYDPGTTGQLIAAEHSEWSRRHGGSLPEPFVAPVPRADGRLRVGYLCTEARSSPVFQFLSPLLRHHDRRSFDLKLYCQDSRLAGDAARAGVEEAELVDVTGWPESRIAGKIREDAVDVLVFPSGHFAGRSLSVAAMRAAPVQIAYPSYPSTTGVPEMDYILTDRWTCEPGQEHQYTETPYWLESGYLVYRPPTEARLKTPLPALRNGFVTFGLFQRPAKTNPLVWDAVARILKQVENSRLFLHHCSIELDIEWSESRRMLITELEARGVEPARIGCRGFVSRSEHLRLISTVDLALDTFPYSGQTTTCECLWMGVPVVTLGGRTHASRVSAGLVQRLGLADLAADSVESYVRRAVEAARDLTALQALRRELRTRFRRSTLADGARLAREVETAYRWMREQAFSSRGRPGLQWSDANGTRMAAGPVGRSEGGDRIPAGASGRVVPRERSPQCGSADLPDRGDG